MASETPFGILHSTFFDGDTGMRLQKKGTPGLQALFLGAWLSANQWANMIGLYELSPSKMARCLPALKGKVLTRAFDLLSAERYAHYDDATEFVWVREMARIRLDLARGVPANADSKRIKGALNLYQRLPLNPFLGDFWDRYHVELAIKHRRNGLPSPKHQRSITDGSPIEDRSVSPRTPLPVPSTSDQDQVPGITDQVPVKAAAAPLHPHARTLAHGDNVATVEALTSLIRLEVFPLLGSAALYADIKDTAASLCSQRGMRWQPDDMRKAIESSEFRDRLMPRLVKH